MVISKYIYMILFPNRKQFRLLNLIADFKISSCFLWIHGYSWQLFL